MTTTPTPGLPDPDAVTLWKIERTADLFRIGELEYKSTTPDGLTTGERAEWRRLRERSSLSLAEWVGRRVEDASRSITKGA